MYQEDIFSKILEYIIPPDGDGIEYVYKQMMRLLEEGCISLTLEDHGILTLEYETGNPPIIKLSEGAALDFRLAQYIHTWLDYQWRNSNFTVLRPYRTGSIITLRKRREAKK